MSPDLETILWISLRQPSNEDFGIRMPRDTIQEMVDKGLISNHKQAHRTLEKWNEKGWYEYGVALDLGWKTIDVRPILVGRE